MARRLRRAAIGSAIAATAAALMTIAPAANAGVVNGYYNTGYTGGVGVSASTWYNSAGLFNDSMSSFTHSGTSTYYENTQYRGEYIIITNNCDDLRHHPYPTGISQNWNDRISSFQ